MGRILRPWWTKHRTVIFAIAFSAGLSAAIWKGHFEASRAVFPLSVVWALAFHSIDSRKFAERVETAVAVVQQARVDCQQRDYASLVQDVAKGLQTVQVAQSEASVTRD